MLCLALPWGGAEAQRAEFALSAEDVFRSLPDALEQLDRNVLGQLLARTEIRVELGAAAGRGGALYSPEQVIYMLEDYLQGLQLTAPVEAGGMTGFRSRSGAVACECYPGRARAGRVTGVLHLHGRRDRQIVRQRLYLGLREGDGGYRIVELRLLP